MSIFKKKSDLYLSDRQPLTFLGKVSLGLVYFVLISWSVIVIWPLYQMVVSAFNGRQQQYLIMNDAFEFSLRHFDYLFNNTLYLSWVKNTIFIASSTAILTLIMVSFTGFAYSRYRFKGRKASLMAIMLIQTIPAFAGITAYFTMHSVISSVFPYLTRQMMLILIYAGTGIAGNTFILKGYIDSISTELDDAARIDGCSDIKVYRLIIMPIARPMLAIIALWSFIGPFMDFLMPRVLLTTPSSYTLAAGLFTLINDFRTLNQPAFAAGGLLTAVPIVALFIILQKQLVSGLAKGAVKG
ncbi:arabinogalactan oligomer/maltooligosaccharide transport system permease protein [Acetoanaerobium pronyense]|uniref:Arabinogalactan oligomer/maltooligosaccharide transport system permease protein n=1 Tax=Acetoanaerobium pronyense TaxID=1482736 RepID=A0ABS4KM19_9FIRM|nr:sugar ABC transporter permease [Acetoanaerobium pronyense]MBP2027664.1 arabinogalactan oligomer/maltooligosaccharide transport system permease protein [Acetoanaerobium pronyense]